MKDLLKKLKKRYQQMVEDDPKHACLCDCCIELDNHNIIDSVGYRKLMNYIRDHKPEGAGNYLYWYDNTKYVIWRLKWLDKHIKLNS